MSLQLHINPVAADIGTITGGKFEESIITGALFYTRWVGAVSEFLSVLHSSPYIHGQQQIGSTGVHSPLESSIDKYPYINIMEDGLVTALINDEPNNNEATALLDARTILHCCSPLSPKLIEDGKFLRYDRNNWRVLSPTDPVFAL
ncbi:uncharacterized protein A4U43_C06F12620 [Asparagus officinalis]|uniref:Uncharacterized protein n=1 Tax=Asparagus officinalis TaxID=4686 RepID=A0A5P1EM33_ASPOF|nr:uncharacterized protein A4U43_C06F12620 [Asparagus officinalis]